MKWYAIRTLPGAQLPRREYDVETTALGSDGRPRGKGYRIVPSLNGEVSAVERALTEAGFTHFMPVEKRLLRDRRKTGVWKGRRFPILLGYLFVQGPEDGSPLDCERVRAVPGVAGVVGSVGCPMPIHPRDIATLREWEMHFEAKFQWEKERRENAEKRVTRSKAGVMYPSGSRVSILKGPAQGRTAVVVGTDRDGRIKAIADGLNAMGTVSLPLDAVQLVA